eukprot:XP_001710176.1 Hypothetical protein GL50803_24837 [Giardia lamblia ATCC 50803]
MIVLLYALSFAANVSVEPQTMVGLPAAAHELGLRMQT